MENQPTLIFSFGPKRSWWVLLGVAVLLAIVEMMAMLAISRVFDDPASRLAMVMTGASTVLVLVACASPLWGSIRLANDKLCVRFGVLAFMDIPFAAIERVQISELVGASHPGFGIEANAELGRLKLAMSSTEPLLEIRTGERLSGRLLHRRFEVNVLRLSVENASTVVDALAAAMRARSSEHEQ